MSRPIIRNLLFLALAFFSFLMIRLTWPYTAMSSDVGFLHSKAAIYHLRYWRISFYAHVFTSCGALLAGFTQFAPRLLHRYPRIHRLMGWVYLVIVTTISGPAGLIMGFHANGGWAARCSFIGLATLWITFTAFAGYYAVRRRFDLHGAFMFLSYALTLSAVTLRLYTYLIEAASLPLSPREIYILTAWLCWAPNLLVAGILISKGWVQRMYR